MIFSNFEDFEEQQNLSLKAKALSKMFYNMRKIPSWKREDAILIYNFNLQIEVFDSFCFWLDPNELGGNLDLAKANENYDLRYAMFLIFVKSVFVTFSCSRSWIELFQEH